MVHFHMSVLQDDSPLPFCRHRHRRAEFEVVRSAEDFTYGAAIDGIDESSALPEAVSKDGMP
jgi:hypothetical protein